MRRWRERTVVRRGWRLSTRSSTMKTTAPRQTRTTRFGDLLFTLQAAALGCCCCSDGQYNVTSHPRLHRRTSLNIFSLVDVFFFWHRRPRVIKNACRLIFWFWFSSAFEHVGLNMMTGLQPSTVETESEEYRSHNNTESDLEV